MDTTQIAVIIPVYAEKQSLNLRYFRQCLHSIAAQDFDSYEVIIVDDCSPAKEDIENILKNEFITLPYKLIRLKENKGPGVARQKGMEYVFKKNIPFITFVDSDDILVPCALDRWWNTIVYNDLDVVYSEIISGNNFENQESSIMKTEDSMTWVFNKIYRSSFLQDFNIHFHSDLRDHEDAYFTNILLAAITPDKMVPLEEPLYYWRRNKDSYTQRLPNIDLYISYIKATCFSLDYILASPYVDNIHNTTNSIAQMYNYYEHLKVIKSDKIDLQYFDDIIRNTLSNPLLAKNLHILETWTINQEYIMSLESINANIPKEEASEFYEHNAIMFYPDSFYSFLVNHGFRIRDYQYQAIPYGQYLQEKDLKAQQFFLKGE